MNKLNQNFSGCSQCAYKDSNDQIGLIDCNSVALLNSYVCQLSNIFKFLRKYLIY
jgi:hypothetical protein